MATSELSGAHRFHRDTDGSVRLRLLLTAEEAADIERRAGSTPLMTYVRAALAGTADEAAGRRRWVYDIEEAAAILGVGRGWLYGQVSAGSVPHTRLGKHIRFTDQHLRSIIAQGEHREDAIQDRRRSRGAKSR